MKRFMILVVCTLAVPAVSEAQMIGVDGGLGIIFPGGGGDNVTTLIAPNPALRLSFPGQSLTFETLVSLAIVNSNGTVTAIQLVPGINFPLGDNGTYLRGEVPISIASGGGDTETDFGIGGAIGTLRPLGDTPLSLRLEAGYDQWLGDADYGELRATVGFSVDVG